MSDSLLIIALPDGSFHLKEGEGGAEPNDGNEPEQPPIDQTVKTADEAMQLVQQFLGDEAGEVEDAADNGADEATEPEAPEGAPPPKVQAKAWNMEASRRGPSGFRK